MLMDSLNIIALIIIVGGGGWLNWHDLKHKRIVFKRYIRDFWNRWKKRVEDFAIDKEINSASVLLCIASVFIVLALWVFGFDIYDIYVELHGQIIKGGGTPEEYRGIAIRYFGIIAGAGAVIGYIIAIARNITANKQNRVAGEQNKINDRARITESMVQAIAQIGAVDEGKPNIEVRLGGLYSLQRIMQDNPEQESAIARIFYAYVRENVKKDRAKQVKQSKIFENNKKLEKNEKVEKEYLRLPEDVQAVLIIISQLNEEWRERGIEWLHDLQLNFSYTNFSNYFLKGLDVRDTNLEHANFSDTDLHFAQLSGASFHQVNFSGAMFYAADLSNAHFAYANFSDTDLIEVNLDNANLFNIDLTDADLTEADLSGVDLSKVLNLTQDQIEQADSRGDTQLNEDLTRPEHWERTEQDLEEDYANQEPDWDEYRKRDE